MMIRKTGLLIALIMLAAPKLTMAGGLAYPVIPNFAGINPLPHAAAQTDADKDYKVLFDVTKGPKTPADINSGVFHVAKAVNIMASADVPLSNLHIVAVLHGKATASVLDNRHYKAKFGVDNPNIALFKALRHAGVTVYVCGQSMIKEGYQLAWANRNVRPALSAISTLIIYGNQGYAYVKQ